jgi:DNA-binding response OmpR family regulator
VDPKHCPANEFRFGPYHVDVARRRLAKHGETVKLQPRPFDVLVYLLRNAGRPVTRQELATHVWQRTPVESTAIEAAIRAIRKALDESHANAVWLKTVGDSYQCCPPDPIAESLPPPVAKPSDASNTEGAGPPPRFFWPPPERPG